MGKDLEVARQVTDYPTEYERRNCTDVCCIYLGVAFTIFMIAAASSQFSYENFFKMNFPTDQDGKLCGVDDARFPFVYFANPPDITRRVCVRECPQLGEKQLKCKPTSTVGCRFQKKIGYEVINYKTQQQETRSGNFCLPKEEGMRNLLLRSSNLEERHSFFNSIDTIFMSFFVALLVSLVYMLLVQCVPSIMNYLVVALGCVMIVAAAVCVFLYRTPATAMKNIIGIILLCVLLIIIMTICKNTDSWRMHSIFLSYSTKMLSQRGSTLFYIPLFTAALVGFALMLVLEFVGFWTHGTVHFSPTTDIYYYINSSTGVVYSIFLVLQGIWGLTFIKQAFNFCVSGQAVGWYFEKDEHGFAYQLKLLWCKHFGSIVTGSFITGTLSVGDLIFDFLKPDENANPESCYNESCQCLFKPCFSLFDLVRSDAMAFINMTGNPFMNSARYCEFLCDRSIIMDYSQSTSRAYRICAHFLITSIISIYALYSNENISIYALIVVMVQTIFLSTLFISVHADATEAIQIIFLTQEEFVRKEKERQGNYLRDNIQENLQTQINQSLAKDVKNQRQIQRRRRNEEEMED